MIPSPPPVRRLPRLARLLPLLALLALPAVSAGGAPLPPGFEIRGHWRVLDGFWHRGEDWRFVHPDSQRASLRVELPPGPLLPRCQILVKDGAALLHWTEPATARPLLAEDSPILARLHRLPARAWAAWLTGRGLEEYMAISESRRSRQGWIRVGSLAGHPARLEGAGSRCRTLLWGGPEGPLVCRWRERPEGRWLSLEIRSRGKPLLQLRMRPPIHRPLGPEDWLFLSP